MGPTSGKTTVRRADIDRQFFRQHAEQQQPGRVVQLDQTAAGTADQHARGHIQPGRMGGTARQPGHELGHTGQPGTVNENGRFRSARLETDREQRDGTVGGQLEERRAAATPAAAENPVGAHTLDEHRRNLGGGRRRY